MGTIFNMSKSPNPRQSARCLSAALLGILAMMAGTCRADEPSKPLPAKADFQIAPDGNDSNPGTAAAPFATLTRARDAVRAKIAAGLTGDVLVEIRGGVYPVTETVSFDAEDSGTDKHSITYAAAPGETVVLSGGRRITGWKKGAGEIWTAELPEVRAGEWYFRQLFVNGNRAIRARTPNAGDKVSWWRIDSSTANKDNPPAENASITVKVSGSIKAYRNVSDVELVYMENNDDGRKRLGSTDEQAQTITLALPNRWNPKVFGTEWTLSIPSAGKPCYLENALEMLDQPGEWYLDRQTGVLHYWPLPGEVLAKADAVAPVLQRTMLAVIGTPGRPVVNLHFEGLQVQHVEWPLPPWGYMGMACCTEALPYGPKPGFRPIDAAVEFTHARLCSFSNGGIAHVGAMGLCLRDGTSHITLEGNEISDLGAGGIAAGWPNSAAGYLEASPPPAPGEYTGYRIANNDVHHCGMCYYGAVGILMFPSHQTVVAHNLIHDTAYFGIGIAGGQDPKVTFDGDNVVEYNHIHHAMTTTVDGAGIYVIFAQNGRGTLLRGNVIHDTHGNPNHGKWGEHPPSAGLYLDGDSQGGTYENNVLYRNFAAGPLIFDNADGNLDAQEKNRWIDNTIEKDGMPPAEFLDAVQAFAGLEPAYAAKVLGAKARPCSRYVLGESSGQAPWSAIQFDLPAEGRGVVQVMAQNGGKGDVARFKLCGLDGAVLYQLHAYTSPVVPTNVWGPGQMPMLGETTPADLAALGLSAQVAGRDLLTSGLAVTLGRSPRAVWIAYQALPAAGL